MKNLLTQWAAEGENRRLMNEAVRARFWKMRLKFEDSSSQLRGQLEGFERSILTTAWSTRGSEVSKDIRFEMILEVLKRIDIPVEVPDSKFLIKKLAIIEKYYKI